MMSQTERDEERRKLLEIEHAEARIKRLEVVQKHRQHPAVAALLEDVRISLETAKAQRDHLTEGSIELLEEKIPGDFKAAVRFWGGEIRAYKGVIANVERGTEKIAALEGQISAARDRLRALREQHPAHEPVSTTTRKRGNIV